MGRTWGQRLAVGIDLASACACSGYDHTGAVLTDRMVWRRNGGALSVGGARTKAGTGDADASIVLADGMRR